MHLPNSSKSRKLLYQNLLQPSVAKTATVAHPDVKTCSEGFASQFQSFVLVSKFPLPDNVPFFREIFLIKPILQHLLCAISIPCLQQTVLRHSLGCA